MDPMYKVETLQAILLQALIALTEQDSRTPITGQNFFFLLSSFFFFKEKKFTSTHAGIVDTPLHVLSDLLALAVSVETASEEDTLMSHEVATITCAISLMYADLMNSLAKDAGFDSDPTANIFLLLYGLETALIAKL
ncbi:hypothetical protein ACJX0J_011380 [Zea mays]